MTMVIEHHPDGATLMSYAAGTLPEALTAVVAAHLSMCPTCRAAVRDLDHVGAALLSQGRREMGPSRTPRRERRSVEAPARSAAPAPCDRLPPALARAYGLTIETVPWKRLGPGVWHHRLPLRQPGDGDLRLLRIAPGRAMPDHGHGGSELTLVIEGSYRDVSGRYGRGDVQDVDEGIDHQPIVEAGEPCICLVASEHPARFKSIIGRIMQPWTGM
jgi:putative transcriptional regulator